MNSVVEKRERTTREENRGKKTVGRKPWEKTEERMLKKEKRRIRAITRGSVWVYSLIRVGKSRTHYWPMTDRAGGAESRHWWKGSPLPGGNVNDLREFTRGRLFDRARDGRWSLRELERVYILDVLESVNGHRGNAARILGIDRRTLYRKLKEYQTREADRPEQVAAPVPAERPAPFAAVG